MKDKLVKNGHKKTYYRMKAVAFSFVMVLGLAAVVSIPSAITYFVEEQRLAAEAPKDETSGSSSSEIVSYVEE